MDRSVASLTTEQLYRKRALDRVNQRASRARKRTRVAELEDEVSSLKQQLAQSEEQVKRLQHSEATLLNAINSAGASLQMIDAATIHTQTAIPSPPASTSTPTQITRNELSPPVSCSPTSPPITGPHMGQIRDTEAAHTISEQLDFVSSDLALRDDSTGLILGLSQDPSDDMFQYLDSDLDWSFTNAFSFSFMDQFPDTLPSALPDTLPTDLERTRAIPLWERLPLHVEAMTRLDTVLLDIIQSSRQRAAESNPAAEISEPTFPSIQALVNPDTKDVHNAISNAIGQHGRITMRFPGLAEKIATMYNMCMVLRWLLSPTKRNYDAMPHFLRPIELQLTTPHPIWVDMVVWPEAREQLIRLMDWADFPTWRMIGIRTMSVNWPHDHSTILEKPSVTEVRLNPAFEKHIRQLKFWTMGAEVRERYPFLTSIPSIVGQNMS